MILQRLFCYRRHSSIKSMRSAIVDNTCASSNDSIVSNCDWTRWRAVDDRRARPNKNTAPDMNIAGDVNARGQRCEVFNHDIMSDSTSEIDVDVLSDLYANSQNAVGADDRTRPNANRARHLRGMGDERRESCVSRRDQFADLRGSNGDREIAIREPFGKLRRTQDLSAANLSARIVVNECDEFVGLEIARLRGKPSNFATKAASTVYAELFHVVDLDSVDEYIA